jgi:hypothetical protein
MPPTLFFFIFLRAGKVSPSLAQLAGVVMVFGNAMFAGGAPTLKQLAGMHNIRTPHA